MGTRFVRSWKVAAFRGLAAALFGLATLLWGGITLGALVLLFGVYSLVDGVLAIVAGARPRSSEAERLVEGLVGMAFGLIALFWFGMTMVSFVHLVALWAVLTGLLELVAAVRVHHEIPGELSLAFAGSGSLMLGVVLFLWPTQNAFVFVILLGCYAMFFGASMLVLALQLRRLTTRFESFHTKYSA